MAGRAHLDTWAPGLQQEVLTSLCSSLAENGSRRPSHREAVVHGHDGRSQRQEGLTYRRLEAQRVAQVLGLFTAALVSVEAPCVLQIS